MNLDFSLLHSLLKIKSPSGDEIQMKNFILDYLDKNRSILKDWEVMEGPHIQDCLILNKGRPNVAFISHMDTVGFTARYENQLVPIGSPDVENGADIVGEDELGLIECKVKLNQNGRLFHNFNRPVIRGTSLVFKPYISESSNYIYASYLDNRIGIFLSLQLLNIIENGMLVFSCWEEIGGGSIPYLAKIIYEDYRINQVIIADVTWITDGILPGNGVAISLRDRSIPRRLYIEKIISIAHKKSIPYQLEVEGEGSSDGGEIQRTPYPINWGFIGPPVENTHTPREKVHKKDIISTFKIYQALAQNL